ncbi:MAG: ribbon-helix-helix protein, CopG family [bacterium]|nr:ribbon-helix-helix protein, CopG family [bacterium]
MARLKRSQDVQRLNLTTTKQVREKMEILRDKTNADSLAEVIRRSLALYEYILEEKERGARMFARTDDGEERELIIL